MSSSYIRTISGVSLSLATALLLILSLAINGENPRTVYGKLSIRMILYGVISGLLLYGLFYFGFQIIKSTSFLIQGVNSVYGFRSTKPAYVIALLLIFPIAPGEETYWRGLVQRRLTERVGPRAGLLLCGFRIFSGSFAHAKSNADPHSLHRRPRLGWTLRVYG